ncbi:Wall-associated receptor kinase 3 [Hordeum vulgare]|nr:Wall-associated receptor kinase 3 [Hordeum vulgare]
MMLYYGLDFHHMDSNNILHLASLITVCEAFSRCQPHSGLWLKIFGFKPKSSRSELSECGVAMVSKNQNAHSFKGTLIKTVKEWQCEWLYISEPLIPGQDEVTRTWLPWI